MRTWELENIKEESERMCTEMMRATHCLGGIAAGAGLAYIMTGTDNLYSASSAFVIGGAVFGSLIPDIDTYNSNVSRKLPLISVVVTLFQWTIKKLSYLLPKKYGREVRAAIGHRGITHSLIVFSLPLLAALGCHIAGVNHAFLTFTGIMAGMASHLILDMFANGVPLFSPFTHKRVTLAKIKTGGVAELLFRVLAFIAVLGVFGDRIMKSTG